MGTECCRMLQCRKEQTEFAIEPFKLVIMKAENVRNCEMNIEKHRGDFYVKVMFFDDIPWIDPRHHSSAELKKLRFKTATIKHDNTGCPSWYHLKHVPSLHSMNTRIVLQVWDKDSMGKDDFAGEVTIPLGKPDPLRGFYIPTFEFPLQARLPLKGRIDSYGIDVDKNKKITGYLNVLLTRNPHINVTLE